MSLPSSTVVAGKDGDDGGDGSACSGERLRWRRKDGSWSVSTSELWGSFWWGWLGLEGAGSG